MMRVYLELKDGSFLGTKELLPAPRPLERPQGGPVTGGCQFRVGVKGKGEKPD